MLQSHRLVTHITSGTVGLSSGVMLLIVNYLIRLLYKLHVISTKREHNFP